MNPGLFDLTNRVAVVTGAGEGIGRAIAVGLAQHGANIVACDKEDATLTETIAKISDLGRAGLGVHCDVGKAADILQLFREVDRHFGQLDILINNVGNLERAKPVELSLAKLQSVLRTGVEASLLCSQLAFPRMAKHRRGSIINVSSIAGATALGRGNLSHSVNKAAIHGLTRELAVEWAKDGIRVNAILPCQTMTEGFQKWRDSPGFDQALMDRFLQGIPMNRLATPEDMVGPAVFLASDAAAMVTGTLLAVDGGNLAFNATGSHTW